MFEWYKKVVFVGSIWLLILFFTEGDSGTNAYGLDPKNDFEEIDQIGTAEL